MAIVFVSLEQLIKICGRFSSLTNKVNFCIRMFCDFELKCEFIYKISEILTSFHKMNISSCIVVHWK